MEWKIEAGLQVRSLQSLNRSFKQGRGNLGQKKVVTEGGGTVVADKEVVA